MSESSLSRLHSGVPGLDELLRGGYIAQRMYLVLGESGAGKTLLGNSFLTEGLAAGENVLYIHGEESQEQILTNAARVGIDIDEADFLDLGPESDFFSEDRGYELVEPRDASNEEAIERIRDAIEDLDPSRVLLDPIDQLRSLEPTEDQYQKRIISFIRFLRERGTTVLATQTVDSATDSDIKSLSDGIISLEHGTTGRRIRIQKHRGEKVPAGKHGLSLSETGVEVFPSLVPEPQNRNFDPQKLQSGVPQLDKLLSGGLERGSVTIISGPTGVGKTTTATEFLANAASSGVTSYIALFEEYLEEFQYRSSNFGIPIEELRDEGALITNEVEPLSTSPEEFGQNVVSAINEHGIELVVIDGTDGYKTALYGDPSTTRQTLHALIRHLKNQNVTVILTDEISQVTGVSQPTSGNLSYLADNIILQNYIEQYGHIDRVIGVLKKRLSSFEDTLRPFTITEEGIEINETQTDIHGILEGTPRFVDSNSDQPME